MTFKKKTGLQKIPLYDRHEVYKNKQKYISFKINLQPKLCYTALLDNIYLIFRQSQCFPLLFVQSLKIVFSFRPLDGSVIKHLIYQWGALPLEIH